jgi:hypothetical protein
MSSPVPVAAAEEAAEAAGAEEAEAAGAGVEAPLAAAEAGPEDGLAASSFLGATQMRLWNGQSLTCRTNGGKGVVVATHNTKVNHLSAT